MKKNTSKKIFIYLSSLIVLIVCMGIGLFLAANKPLWNDEIFTQVASIESMSYIDILKVKFYEGNSSPMFYLTQKGIGDLFNYKFPGQWKGEWKVEDYRSQMILRINPNLFMSLSITCIFFFFVYYYSWFSGIYSLLISLSSYMVWVYWVDARPYALWVFLTTVQSLVFLSILKQTEQNNALWRLLILFHLLLSLTVVFGALQIAGISLLLYLLKEKNLRKYIFMTVVPVCICIVYYFISPKFKFWFADSTVQLICASIPRDRILILAVYLIFVLLYYLQERIGIIKVYDQNTKFDGWIYLVYTAMMLAAAVAVSVLFSFSAGKGHEGFQISNRYFIYLTPLGVIAATLFSVEMINSYRGQRPVQILLILCLTALLVFRLLRTYSLVMGYY